MADFIFRKSFQCTKWKTLRNYTSRRELQEPTLSSQIVFRSIDLISLHINREFDLQDEGPKSTVLDPFWFFSPVTLQRSVPHPVSSFMIMGVWYEKAVYTVWFRMCNIGNSELRVQYSVRLYFRCLLLTVSCQPHVPQSPQHWQLDATKFSVPQWCLLDLKLHQMV